MGENIIEILRKLSHIHAKYDVYSENQIKGNVKESIIEDIRLIPRLKYLANYYDTYFDEYQKQIEGNWNNNTFKGDSIARSTDLPFIGSDVLESGTANYLFVFKGSLQSIEKLSMTVLSCFWIFNNNLQYQNIFNKYWPSQNYNLLLENLGITPEIAKKSYVTDFARIPHNKGTRDTKKCRALLLDEIEILKPNLVILVGAEPRNVFISELERNPDKFITVPFSLKGVPKKTQEEGPLMYEDLRSRYSGQ